MQEHIKFIKNETCYQLSLPFITRKPTEELRSFLNKIVNLIFNEIVGQIVLFSYNEEKLMTLECKKVQIQQHHYFQMLQKVSKHIKVGDFENDFLLNKITIAIWASI